MPWEFEFPFPGSLISTFLGSIRTYMCTYTSPHIYVYVDNTYMTHVRPSLRGAVPLWITRVPLGLLFAVFRGLVCTT